MCNIIFSHQSVRWFANPAHGQLNRENEISLSPFAPENFCRETGSSRPASAGSFSITILRLKYCDHF